MESLGESAESGRVWDRKWHADLLTRAQNGLAETVTKSRKQIKERKNRTKKLRGVKKVRRALCVVAASVCAG